MSLLIQCRQVLFPEEEIDMLGVFPTEFGWSRAHLMKNKGNAHETLSLLFKRDGVPPKDGDGWIKGADPWIVQDPL